MTDEEFTALYPTTPNPELMRLLGCSMPTVTRRARRLGLAKDEATRYAHTKKPKSVETRAKMSAATKGKTFSQETRARMSAARTGRPLTDEHRANISKANKGKPKPAGFAEKKRGVPLPEAHRAAIAAGVKRYRARASPGGIRVQPFGRGRYTPAYREFRRACLDRDAWTCQDCGRVFAPGQRGIQVHHLKPYARYVTVRLDPANGVSACVRCHRKRHTLHPVTDDDYERIDKVPCACGCGEMMYPITDGGRPRRYIRYHNRRGITLPAESREKIARSLRGRRLAGRPRKPAAI